MASLSAPALRKRRAAAHPRATTVSGRHTPGVAPGVAALPGPRLASAAHSTSRHGASTDAPARAGSTAPKASPCVA